MKFYSSALPEALRAVRRDQCRTEERLTPRNRWC
jgi:hypothetical protein